MKKTKLLTILFALCITLLIFVVSISAETARSTSNLRGDANEDGVVDTRDLIVARQYLANFDYNTGTSGMDISSNADMDRNGSIRLLDVKLLREYIINKENEPEIKYSEGLVFTSNGDGTCYVSSVGSCTDADLNIPPTSPEGDEVTGIGDSAFKNCSFIENVKFPETLKTIGKYAFENCTLLTSIDLPEELESIGLGFLKGCNNIQSLSTPFIGRDNTSGTVPDVSAQDYVLGHFFGYTYCKEFYNTQWATTEPTFRMAEVGNKPEGTTFQYGYYIKEWISSDQTRDYQYSYYYYIPESLKCVVVTNAIKIPKYAFVNCNNIETVFINKEITEISSENIFKGCTSLQNISFEEGSDLTTIANNAFRNCISLQEIVIPSSVTTMGTYVFYGCTSLTKVKFEDNILITEIPLGTFYKCTSLQEITIPYSVNKISTYVFYGCTNLTNVYFEDIATGWYVNSNSSVATSGTNVTVENASANAINLKSTYRAYFWFKK